MRIATTAAAGMGGTGTSKAQKDDYLITRFGALCFFLSAVECIIPKPLPFLRLGISNVPLIIAAGFFSAKAYFLLALVKVVAQGLLGGTFFSWIFLFSAAGTAMSAVLMLALKRALRGAVSAIGLSVAGAFASNVAQLALAFLWIFGEGARAIAPLLLVAGVVSGLAVGVFAEIFEQKSLWLKKTRRKAESGALKFGGRQETAAAPVTRKEAALSVLRVAAGVASILMIGAFPALEVRIGFFAAFYAALCLAGRRPRSLPIVVSVLAIAVCNIYPPRGAIIAEIAGFRIGAESLAAAVSRALFFEALIFISRWTFMQGKIKLPQLNAVKKSKSRVTKAFARLSFLLAETIALFGKLSAKPNNGGEPRSSPKHKLSIKAAALYIDSLLQRIAGDDDTAGAKGE